MSKVGASMITKTVLGVPYYSYGIIYPKTLFQFFKAPILVFRSVWLLNNHGIRELPE